MAYLSKKNEQVGDRAPTLYDLAAWFRVERTTLYRHARKLGVKLRSDDFQAKVSAAALNLNMDAAERELPSPTPAIFRRKQTS